MKSWLAIPRSRFPAFGFALVLLISLTSLQVCQAMRATYCNVKIEDAVWTSGYDPITCAVSDTHPDSNPILCGKCGSKVVGGGAFFGYQTGAGCGTDVEVDGSVSIEDHGTGALIEQLAEGAWLVSEPQHSGSITVKATVSGFCDCPNTTSITLTAVGTLTVIVPSDEDGGCSVCSSSCSAPTGSAPPLGNGSVNCDSLDFQMSLGPATTARGAGLILLHTNTASADLATSHPLVLYAGPDTTVLPGANGTVRQVKCPQGLVHVKTNSAYEYHIQCYYDSDYNHTLQADGFYATNSGAQP